ncbi:hypothetical protein CBS101457_004958 [Exobasidium rhododendri]|nr:hypothetical protein CBS101457_004958 [Exobasidium rhododendri]
MLTTSTSLATLTSTIVSTATSTATVTSTSSTTTATTTTSPTTYATTTTTGTPVATSTVSSSTIFVVAPTGIIRGLGADDAPEGYLAINPNYPFPFYELSTDVTIALSFIVTQDANTGYLSLEDINSGLTFGAETSVYASTDLSFSEGTPDYAYVTGESPAFSKPGPASGTGALGYQYETWIIDTVNIPSAGSTSTSVELLPVWINQDGTPYTSSLMSWASFDSKYDAIALVADRTSFNSTYPGQYFPVRLFFGP